MLGRTVKQVMFGVNPKWFPKPEKFERGDERYYGLGITNAAHVATALRQVANDVEADIPATARVDMRLDGGQKGILLIVYPEGGE